MSGNNFNALRNWLFERLIIQLRTNKVRLYVIDFSKQDSSKTPWMLVLGLHRSRTKRIYLTHNKRYNRAKILIHELGHALFQDTLEKEVYLLPPGEYLKNGRLSKHGRRLKSIHAEEKITDFGKLFYQTLTPMQKLELNDLINSAKLVNHDLNQPYLHKRKKNIQYRQSSLKR